MKIADNSLRKLHSQRSNQQHLKAMSKDSANHQGIDELAESPPVEPVAMSGSTSYAAPADASNVESSARSASERRRDFASSQTEAESTECELDRSSMTALRRKRLSFQVAAGNELTFRRPLGPSRRRRRRTIAGPRICGTRTRARRISQATTRPPCSASGSRRVQRPTSSAPSASISCASKAHCTMPPLCSPAATATSGTTELLLPADYSTGLNSTELTTAR